MPHLQIQILQFNGPLDLLLQLIESQKMDITEIAIAGVTEQFLAHIKQLDKIEPTILADFLSMAAKLLVIKSKSILPTLELEQEEQEVAHDLENRLTLYKRFKEATKHIKNLDAQGILSMTRETSFEEKTNFYPDPEVGIETLHTAILAVAKLLEEIHNIPKSKIKQAISIQEKIASLQSMIGEQIETKMSNLLATAKDKTEVIVTFLALLELIKQRILTVEQEQIFSEITIKKYGLEIDHEPTTINN